MMPRKGPGWALLVAAAALADCGGSGVAAGGGQSQSSDGSSAQPSTFYINAVRGHDGANGTSRRTAWQTLGKVLRGHFTGGDRILLRGGQSFNGRILLGANNLSATSPAAPLEIGSYGGGRATIRAFAGLDGIAADNVAGIHITGINVVGHGARSCNEQDASRWGYGDAGLRFEAHSLNGTLDQGITVDHVDVSGFCDGVVVASADDGSRISGVRVAAVRAYDNGGAGVWTYDQANSHHSIRNVTVTNTRVYRNNSRGGIALFGVDRGVVRNSVAYDNAKRRGGGVGIWAFDSNRVRFVHDESYRNGRATLDNDGDGFDFDRGVSNSLMAHDYSHDNGGVGFLICSCTHYGRYYSMHNITVRSSVSRNDGSSGQPSLYVLGGEPMTGIDIADNRIASGTGSSPLVKLGAYGRNYSRVHFVGNTFVTRGGKRLLRADPTHAHDLRFEDNTWRAIGGPFSIQWGTKRFRTLAAWRTGAGVEVVNQAASTSGRGGPPPYAYAAAALALLALLVGASIWWYRSGGWVPPAPRIPRRGH